MVGVLALAGAGIAVYLTYTHAIGSVPVCTTGGCEKVQSSDYAELAGIPVAALGLGAYVAIFATALRGGVPPAAVGAALSLAGAAFALYLLVIQVAVIEALCIWCLGSDVVIGLLAVVSVLRLRAAAEPEPGS